jgi:hypothetical protein
MLSQSLARGLASRGVHYGWVMLVLAMGYGVCASATLGIPGVLLVPITNEFGWSVGDLSGPLGLRMALFGRRSSRPACFACSRPRRRHCCAGPAQAKFRRAGRRTRQQGDAGNPR